VGALERGDGSELLGSELPGVGLDATLLKSGVERRVLEDASGMLELLEGSEGMELLGMEDGVAVPDDSLLDAAAGLAKGSLGLCDCPSQLPNSD